MLLSVYIHGSSPFNPRNSFEEYVNQVKYYENIGLDTLWFADHLIRTPDIKEQPIFETWSLISALAPLTKKIRFGTMVSPITYRNIGLFAKMVSTVDHISKGRLTVGLGTGWYEKEHIMFDIPFPNRSHRFQILEDMVKYLIQLWTTDGYVTSDSASIIKLQNAYLNPKPVQTPHPPILIGGGGEQKTLKLVAKYAQMSNFGGTNDNIRHKLDVLEHHCDVVGTDFSNIQPTSNMAIVIGVNDKAVETAVKKYRQRFINLGLTAPSLENFADNRLVGTPEQIKEQIDQLKAIGIKMINLTVNDRNTEDLLKYVIN